MLGPTALGLYALGFRLPELIVINLAMVAGEVLFAAFAAVDRDALGHAGRARRPPAVPWGVISSTSCPRAASASASWAA